MATNIRKVTISLPAQLLDFTDRLAAQAHTSRSQVISQVLAVVQAQEAARLAVEGYHYYGGEATELAQATASAVAAALTAPMPEVNDGETW